VEEAGGTVSTFDGNGSFLTNGQIIVGSPGVHAALLDVLKRYPALVS
jgi:fructose-1,6-bisphosphatase/inositol monophosphatase family enzyme